jgi:hypothetical protein
MRQQSSLSDLFPSGFQKLEAKKQSRSVAAFKKPNGPKAESAAPSSDAALSRPTAAPEAIDHGSRRGVRIATSRRTEAPAGPARSSRLQNSPPFALRLY